MRFLLPLTLLAACGPSASGEAYDLCIRRLEVYCDCGDYTSNAEDAAQSCKDLEDEDRLFNICGDYDLLRCDPQSDRWDAEGCETVHADIDAWEDAGTAETATCVLDAYARICPGTDASMEEVGEGQRAAADECAE